MRGLDLWTTLITVIVGTMSALGLERTGGWLRKVLMALSSAWSGRMIAFEQEGMAPENLQHMPVLQEEPAMICTTRCEERWNQYQMG